MVISRLSFNELISISLDKNGYTALHLASQCDSPETALLLLKHGANIDVQTDDYVR